MARLRRFIERPDGIWILTALFEPLGKSGEFLGSRGSGQGNLVAEAYDGNVCGCCSNLVHAVLEKVFCWDAPNIDVTFPIRVVRLRFRDSEEIAELFERFVMGVGTRDWLECVRKDGGELRGATDGGEVAEFFHEFGKHLLLFAESARVAGVTVRSEVQISVAFESCDAFDVAFGRLESELGGEGTVAVPCPLPVREGIHGATDFGPVTDCPGGDGDGGGWPFAEVNPIGGVLLPVAAALAFSRLEDEGQCSGVFDANPNVTGLREHAVEGQVVLFFDALSDLRGIGCEHDEVDVASSGGFGLGGGDEGEYGGAGLEVGECVVAFPHDVLGCPPTPAHLGFDFFLEGPDFGAFSGPVNAPEDRLVGLDDLDAELRLESVRSFVSGKDEVSTCGRDVHREGCGRFRPVLWCAKEGFAAEERVCECRCVVVLAESFWFPTAGLVGLKLFCFADEETVWLYVKNFPVCSELGGREGAGGCFSG